MGYKGGREGGREGRRGKISLSHSWPCSATYPSWQVMQVEQQAVMKRLQEREDQERTCTYAAIRKKGEET